MAVANNRSLEGEPMKLIERALQLDPGNLKALSLAGTAAFDRKDFALAVRYWEKLVQAAPKGSPFIAQVQASIEEARQMQGAKAAAESNAAAPADNRAAAGSTTISGTVTLAASLAGQASAGDTVFVYARAAEGSRMPLAIVRKQVKDLPIQFTLDDSSAIMSRSGRRSVPQDAPPPRPRVDPVGDHAVLVLLHLREHRLDQRLREEMRLQPEIHELRVLRVVVVLLELDARVLDVDGLGLQAVV